MISPDGSSIDEVNSRPAAQSPASAPQPTNRAQRLYELFIAALAIPAEDQHTFVREACAEDMDLLKQVEVLLAQDAQANQDRFLEPPSPRSAPDCFTTPENKLVGQRIGCYEIQEWLADGGMGSVYRAVRINDYQQQVAVKLIRAGFETSEMLSRFTTERQILAKLNHPNIARLLDGGTTEDGRPYCVMELISGQPVTRYCDAQGLSVRQRIELLSQVAGAVQYAHDQGIIHRDLKPANVLITDNGAPKLTDFGLAKYRAASSHQTQTGHILGTPCYMAPEQASGKNKEYGPSLDVYALGALMYELLTGRPPFQAATPLETVLQIITDKPIPPRELQPSLPRDLETVCLKCLEKEAGARYGSARAFTNDLERWLERKPIAARRTGPIEKALKWASRKPAHAALWLLLFFFVFVLSAGITIGCLWQRSETALAEAQRQRGIAETALTEARHQRAKAEKSLRGERQAKAVIASLRLLDIARHRYEKQDYVGMRELLDHIEPLQRSSGWNCLDHLCPCRQAFIGHQKGISAVCYSPTGAFMASGGIDRTIRLWDARTGHELFQLSGHRDQIHSVQFSPDGQGLASASEDGTVRIWDLQSRKTTHVLKHWKGVYSVAYSPDGRQLATGSQDQWLRVWDVDNGKEIVSHYGHSAPIWSVTFSSDGRYIASGSEDGLAVVWDRRKEVDLHRMKHSSTVFAARFTPDGKHLATGCGDSSIKLWEVEGGRYVRTFGGHRSAVRALCFRPDGRQLVSASDNQVLKLWDPETGALVHEIVGGGNHAVCYSPDGNRIASCHPERLVAVWSARKCPSPLTLPGHVQGAGELSFHPNGNWVATGDGRGTIRVWSSKTGALKKTFASGKTGILSLSFSPDGKHLASSNDSTVSLRNLDTGSQILLEGHRQRVVDVVFSADGTKLASASDDETVRVWDPGEHQLLFDLKGHKGGATSVAFSPNGSRLASSTQNGIIKIWDLPLRNREAPGITLRGHTAMVRRLAFSPDSSHLASASIDHTVRIWNATTGQLVSRLPRDKSPIFDVQYSPDGMVIASGTASGALHLWDADTGQEILKLKAHPMAIHDLSFSPNGSRFATASWDGTVKIWEASKIDKSLLSLNSSADLLRAPSPATNRGQAIPLIQNEKGAKSTQQNGSHRLRGHTSIVEGVCFSPDSKLLASASYDGTVRVWSTDLRQEIATLRGHPRTVHCVCFSPDGRHLVSGGWDCVARMWDVSTGAPLLVFKGHSAGVIGVCFSPDGKTVATAACDHTVKLWDAATGKELTTLSGHTSSVHSVRFSPNGKVLASGSADRTVRLWNVADRTSTQPVQTLKGHDNYIFAVSFSPDSQRVASASLDGRVKIWDVSRGIELHTLKGHSTGAQGVSFSPDGKWLVSGSRDRTLKVWNPWTGELSRTLTGHTDMVNRVAINHDSRYIASSSHDKTVRLWPLSGLKD